MSEVLKLKPFNINSNDEKVDKVSLTLWVPRYIKNKYDEIQLKSKKRYARHLQEIVINSVESVDIK